MDILFDENGFITPSSIIELSLEEFGEIFIFTKRREEIFRNYLDFLDNLKKMPIGKFHQWLDGSFVTQKPFPNDLDLVTFVDSNFYLKFENRIRDMELEFRWLRLDAYSVPVYPKTTFKQYITKYAIEEKQALYGFDRSGKPKGFIQLNFD
jgi:hypothetical protein